MIKIKMNSNRCAPFKVSVSRPSLTIDEINALIDLKMQELAVVARTGLLSDLSTEWDTEIIFDCGTMDITLAELDTTILD